MNERGDSRAVAERRRGQITSVPWRKAVIGWICLSVWLPGRDEMMLFFFFLFRWVFAWCEIWTVGSDVVSEHNWSFVSPRERSRPQERSLREHKDVTGFYNVVGCWRSSRWDIFYYLCSHIQLCFGKNHGWMEYISQMGVFSPPWNCRYRR